MALIVASLFVVFFVGYLPAWLLIQANNTLLDLVLSFLAGGQILSILAKVAGYVKDNYDVQKTKE